MWHRLQPSWYPLQSILCWAMIGVLYVLGQATLVTTALMCSVISVKTLATLGPGCPDKIPPSGTPNHHDRSCSQPHYDHNHRDRSQFLTTDAAKEDTLTGQDLIANPTVAEGSAAIGGMHPTPHPTTTAAFDKHQLSIDVGDTLARAHCTSTTAIHLRHATFPARVTLKTSFDWSQSSSRHSHHTPHRWYTNKASKLHSQTASLTNSLAEEGHHSGFTIRLFPRIG